MNKNTDGMFCTGVSGSGALPWVVVGEELGVVLILDAEQRREMKVGRRPGQTAPRSPG